LPQGRPSAQVTGCEPGTCGRRRNVQAPQIIVSRAMQHRRSTIGQHMLSGASCVSDPSGGLQRPGSLTGQSGSLSTRPLVLAGTLAPASTRLPAPGNDFVPAIKPRTKRRHAANNDDNLRQLCTDHSEANGDGRSVRGSHLARLVGPVHAFYKNRRGVTRRDVLLPHDGSHKKDLAMLPHFGQLHVRSSLSLRSPSREPRCNLIRAGRHAGSTT
jgi:hypothetical protein